MIDETTKGGAKVDGSFERSTSGGCYRLPEKFGGDQLISANWPISNQLKPISGTIGARRVPIGLS